MHVYSLYLVVLEVNTTAVFQGAMFRKLKKYDYNVSQSLRYKSSEV